MDKETIKVLFDLDTDGYITGWQAEFWDGTAWQAPFDTTGAVDLAPAVLDNVIICATRYTDGQLVIDEAKRDKAENFTIKQMEKARKSLQIKMDSLNDQSRKDNVVTFEELGVDRLFIDESHYFKNLFLYTKMRNVGGIAQTEAQKSSDLFMKCRYLDELTGGRGIVFATGTPISNSMVELYTIQRYLQMDTLQEQQPSTSAAWIRRYRFGPGFPGLSSRP